MQVWLGNFYAGIRPGLAIGSVTARCRTGKISDEGGEMNLGFQWNILSLSLSLSLKYQ
jgi:hypothetical protein